MNTTASNFFISAVAYVTLGMTLGIYMSISDDHTVAGSHVHLNLVGWVTMALYGLYYNAVPAAAEAGLAKLHFWLATLGIWMMIPGIYLVVTERSEIPVATGSFVTLASMLVFLYTVLKNRTS